ncbi:MAG: energy transducer TonB [Pleurocapsa sp.]
MANSQFCIQQRQQEQQKTKRLLVLGLTGSALLHGILAWAMPKWSIEPPKIAEPMELTIVEKPKPKIESKPIVKPEPKPIPKPEPVKAQTPPPPIKPPEPVKAQTAPPKPVPKKVLTSPTPAPSQPIVSAPIENTPKAPALSSSFTAPSSSVTSSETTRNHPGMPGSVVATNSAPPRPQPSSSQGISCISNCEPKYPAALAGAEGSAGVKLTINPDGNVIGAELSSPHSNSQVNQQALLAARQMQFSSPSNGNASVRVKIEFTVAGSQYDRAAREAQEQRERAEKEKKEQEAARQQQLEQERQARQEQLERERQARQQQLQQQQESTPPPVDTTQPAPQPLPSLSEEELEAERSRKFRERMEQYQEK